MTNQIAFLLFAISVGLGLTLLLVIRADRRRQFVQQRLHAITVGKVDVDRKSAPRLSLLRRSASPTAVFQLPRKFSAWLDTALDSTGNRIGLLHLIIAGFIAAMIVILFASRLMALNTPFVVLLGGAAAMAAPVGLFRLAQSRYRSRFLDVFPDALDLIRRAVKAGLPVNEALGVAGREVADPVGSELRRALDQMQIGVQMVDAMQQVSNRVRVADFRFLLVALSLQGKTGGSLAETLGNLSGVIRARKALRLKAHALSAEAKASAAVLAALPFLVGGAMFVLDRDLVKTLFVDPRGRFMVGMMFFSLVTGLITMASMVKRAVR
jgi:Flp pilus assembly protein TadB